MQDSECALISLIVPRPRGVRTHLSSPRTEPHVPRPRYAITVENRLARVEDAVQRLVPMAQAFECWLQTSDQKLPWVNYPSALFRRSDVSCNCTIQFPGFFRDRQCTCIHDCIIITHLETIRDESRPWFHPIATTPSTNNPLLPASTLARRPPPLLLGEALCALEMRTDAHPVPE